MSQTPTKDGWQPIETAPKDGTTIFIYQPDGQWNSRRRNRREVISTGYWHQPANPASKGFWCAAVMYVYRPTHWMPLPAPPVDTKGVK